MSRFMSTLCAMVMLTAGGTALAAEPLKLGDHELDAITAAAQVGAFVDANVAVDGENFPFDDVRFDTGPLNRDVAVGSPDGVAEAQISGRVTVIDAVFFKTAFGIFRGQTRSEGTGQATVGAGTVIDGGVPVINQTRSVSVGNQTYFITLAAVLN